MEQPLRILFLTTTCPYPPTDGGRIAILDSIRWLASRGHQITLLCFGAEKDLEERTVIEQWCSLRIVHHDTRSHLVPALANLVRPTPYTMSKYQCPSMYGAISRALESARYHLVHVEHLHMAHYLRLVKAHHLPVVLREQNVETTLAERYASASSGLKRLYVRLQIRKLMRFEADACGTADRCLAITPVDAQRIRQLNPRARVDVVPAGIDTQYYSPMKGNSRTQSVAFVASMDWPPNEEAILWFCDHVFPIVRQRLPQVRLYVVGRNPPASVLKLSSQPGVTVTGFVTDVREYIADCDVFIAPIHTGSGMRIKILQAMAMGKSVVSTSIGAEGIQVTSGENIIIANAPDTFASSVIQLLTDSALRCRIGANARELVERIYGWSSVVTLIEKAYAHAIQSHHDPLSRR